MNELGLREAIPEDSFLSGLEVSSGVVHYTGMGYPVAEYKGTDIRIAIEPINLEQFIIYDGYMLFGIKLSGYFLYQDNV